MLSIFWGDNRLEAEKAVKRVLGADYEVFEGETLTPTDLPSIFQGTSLFGLDKRRILLKNLSENKPVWDRLVDYLTTEHEIVIWEAKVDKRSATYKACRDHQVVLKEFTHARSPEANLVFNILDTALKDGAQAVRLVERIETEEDPYRFFGLMVTQALKKFEQLPGRQNKDLLNKLAELDLAMKTTSVEPWALVKSFLLRVKA